jgi:hypothetical protein
MQFLVAALIGAFAFAAASMVGRALIALGIGYLTFTGVSTLGSWLMDQMKTAMSGLPTDVSSFLAYMYVDKCLTMLFSAWVVALAFKLGGTDSITAMVLRKPA